MPLEITHEDFLSPKQVLDLKTYLRRRADEGCAAGKKQPARDWGILHVALDAGLRVSEICDLQIRDIILDGEHASIIVRDGKGGKKRGIRVGSALRDHLIAYLNWKERVGEAVSGRAPLFVSSRGGSLTRTAVYRIFRKHADAVSIPKRFSIHSCRHTYASLLYRASDFNLRLVQKQLGHRSIQTTQIYADVLSEDAVLAVEKLPQ